jgi:glycosyltransferase involved in cell wall biosynthesis
MTAALLDALRDHRWGTIHVDTSDRRSVDNIGKFDIVNVVLALCHCAQFTRALLGTRPDIVYLPLSQGVAGFTRDALFLLVARLSTARVVVHAHGGQYQEFYRRMPAPVRALMRFSLARVHLIIVLAESQRGQFDGWAPEQARTVVIPNGVHDEWPAGAPERSTREGGTVLFLGSLLAQKGFLDLLDAVPAVLETVGSARFVFAGKPRWDSDTTEVVRTRLHHPRISNATSFVGVVQPAERRHLLEAADVLVFPPRWNEGQPLVALEAMSAGLPLVVSASGGLAETVRDGIEAIVVPKCDSKAIASAVARLLSDPALRVRMGTAARARFEHEYTLQRWGLRMVEAFDVAAELGGGRSMSARRTKRC